MEPADKHEAAASGEERSGVNWFFPFLVILILLLFGAIAIPNFVKARAVTSKNACVANLKQIDGAIQQWAAENKKATGDAVVMQEAVTYLQGGKLPTCPSGGSYSLRITVGNPPTCSLGVEKPEHRVR